ETIQREITDATGFQKQSCKAFTSVVSISPKSNTKFGVDGKRRVGKSCLISKFAEEDFNNGEYKDTLH
ncbi:1829_t:CDS:2, partial [Scutellospora calospora]